MDAFKLFEFSPLLTIIVSFVLFIFIFQLGRRLVFYFWFFTRSKKDQDSMSAGKVPADKGDLIDDITP